MIPRPSCLTVLFATLSLGVAHAASGDWRADAPGQAHVITPTLPAPHATPSAGNPPGIVPRPAGAMPHVPAGFAAQLWASGLETPRAIRVAPDGDVFVAESSAGRIRVFHTAAGAAHPAGSEVFAAGLDLPFGIAFWPPGPTPIYVYVGETGRVVRYPYRAGSGIAAGPAEIVVPHLPEGGHWTRDVAFSADGQTLFVSVGSASNIAGEMQTSPPGGAAAWQTAHPPGSLWGAEADRADVLRFDPQGGHPGIVATGLRNCAGLAVQPQTGALWCAVNERDGLGDDVPPDYATHVAPGAFYGWPWFYIGDHADHRAPGSAAAVDARVTVPDVLIQPHSAPLGITFYPNSGGTFPAAYDGDAFVALHGSWNRAMRTGYKVIRIRMHGGQPVGGYEDFVTGFVADDDSVWGRPVDVAVAQDGALLVTEDGNGTIWRIAPAPRG